MAAWILLGFGVCFKAMAIYLVPLYIYFYIKNFKTSVLREKLLPLAAVLPVIVCSIPNFLAGGRFMDGIIYPILSRAGSASGNHSFSLLQNSHNTTAVFILAMFAVALLTTVFVVLHRSIPESNKHKRVIELFYIPIFSTIVLYVFSPSQLETYYALATVFAFLAFIVTPIASWGVLFISLNVLLAASYLLISFRWPDSHAFMYRVPVIPVFIDIFLCLIGWMVYLVVSRAINSKKSSLL
jgi:hypothetical protein